VKEEVRSSERQSDEMLGGPDESAVVGGSASSDPELGLGAAEDQKPTTTGGRLRSEREAAGLTLDDVAEVLRFSAHQIDALERDDYARLAGTTLIRGMVRGYAKLLKMPPEPLLNGLDAAPTPSGADVRAPTNIGIAERTTAVDRISRGAVIATSVFVLLFSIVAGYVYVMTDEAALQQSSATTEVPPVVAVAPATPAVVVTPPTVPVDAIAETAQTAAPVITPLPSNTLVLDFDDLSWVEISDATHSIVFRGEHPKGTHHVVDGKAPFQLWIGRASSVRVTYGDRIIDLKPHSRENIARLKVE
jgi:cytoskeleton protein RodZ